MFIILGRVKKSRVLSKKTEERYRLVTLINSFSIDIMPYLFCNDRSLPYRIIEGVSRYKEYIRRSRFYDKVLDTLSV